VYIGDSLYTKEVCRALEDSIITQLTFKQLERFFACLRFGSFSAAATEFHMKPESMSEFMKDFEAPMPSKLFLRDEHNKRTTELTEFGKQFAATARRLYEEMRLMLTMPDRMAAGEVGELRFGFAGSALNTKNMITTLRNYREQFPDVVIDLREDSTETLKAQLLEGSIDVGFMRSPERVDELDYIDMEHEQFIAAIPTSSDLARRLEEDANGGEVKAISLSELRDQDWVLVKKTQNPGYHRQIVRLCQSEGFDPNDRIKQYATFHLTILALVAAGVGVTIVSNGVEGFKLENVTYLQLKPIPKEEATLTLAWRRPGKHLTPMLKVVRNFLLMAGVPKAQLGEIADQ
jgi:DNA-binding transcriptional LysR family regulator